MEIWAVTEEKVPFVVQVLRPWQLRFRVSMLQPLQPVLSSICLTVYSQNCLAFDGCDSRLVGCQDDLNSIQVVQKQVLQPALVPIQQQ